MERLSKLNLLCKQKSSRIKNGIEQVEDYYFVGPLESEKEDRACEVKLLLLFEIPACKA